MLTDTRIPLYDLPQSLMRKLGRPLPLLVEMSKSGFNGNPHGAADIVLALNTVLEQADLTSPIQIAQNEWPGSYDQVVELIVATAGKMAGSDAEATRVSDAVCYLATGLFIHLDGEHDTTLHPFEHFLIGQDAGRMLTRMQKGRRLKNGQLDTWCAEFVTMRDRCIAADFSPWAFLPTTAFQCRLFFLVPQEGDGLSVEQCKAVCATLKQRRANGNGNGFYTDEEVGSVIADLKHDDDVLQNVTQALPVSLRPVLEAMGLPADTTITADLSGCRLPNLGTAKKVVIRLGATPDGSVAFAVTTGEESGGLLGHLLGSLPKHIHSLIS